MEMHTIDPSHNYGNDYLYTYNEANYVVNSKERWSIAETVEVIHMLDHMMPKP